MAIPAISKQHFLPLFNDGGDIRINVCRNDDQGIEKI